MLLYVMHPSLCQHRVFCLHPLQPPLVLGDQVVFCLTVSLDKLPVNTVRAKVRHTHMYMILRWEKSQLFCVANSLVIWCVCQVTVTVWRQEEENVEVREHGYLTLLQLRSPAQTFKQDLSTFKAQGTQAPPSCLFLYQ